MYSKALFQLYTTRAELCMLLYNYWNTLIYLYLDLQSEYYQLSLHFFFDPVLQPTSPFLIAHLCYILYGHVRRHRQPPALDGMNFMFNMRKRE